MAAMNGHRPEASCLLALLLCLVPVAAHVSDVPDSAAFVAGPYSGRAGPAGEDLFAGRPTDLQILLVESATGTPRAASGNVSFEARLGDATLSGPVQFREPGRWSAPVTFPAAGTWNVTLAIDGRLGPAQATVPLPVYPALGYRLRPVDPQQKHLVGAEARIAFLPAWYDEGRKAAQALPADLRVRVERWSEDHATLLDSDVVDAVAGANGTWVVAHRFEELGVHHLRFASASGGFGFADLPPVHVVVQEPAAEPDATPFMVIALATIAVVGIAWGWWRSRRAA